MVVCIANDQEHPVTLPVYQDRIIHLRLPLTFPRGLAFSVALSRGEPRPACGGQASASQPCHGETAQRSDAQRQSRVGKQPVARGRLRGVRHNIDHGWASQPCHGPLPFNPPSRRLRRTGPPSREPRRAVKSFTMPPVGETPAVKCVTRYTIVYTGTRTFRQKGIHSAHVFEQNSTKPCTDCLTHLTKRPLGVRKPAFLTPPGPFGPPR